MSPLVIPVLLASLGGSLHCAAMCGPFIAVVAGSGRDGRLRPTTLSAYHLGRLATYLAFGALAGLAGGALDLAGSAAGVGRVSAIVAGVVLLAWGAAALVPRPKLVKLARRAPERAGALLGRVLARLAALPPTPRALLLGVSTTLVPCGWLYAFIAAAAGTGGVLSALVVMLSFWVGTLPALVGAGFGLRGVFVRLGARARAVSAVLVALSGLVLLGLRMDLPLRLASGPAPPRSDPSVTCPLHPH